MTRERRGYNLAVNVMRCGLRPSEPLTGVLQVPASKSLYQRALIVAALCRDVTRIEQSPSSELGDDVRAAQALVRGVGAVLDPIGEGWASDVRGQSPGPSRGWCSEAALDAGESGTLARLATAAAGLCGRPGRSLVLTARGSLLERDSPALFLCLERAGVRLRFAQRHHGWPVSIDPTAPPAQVVLEHPSSSQEVSALMIATAAWPERIEIVVRGSVPSRPYLEMTIRSLARFGVIIDSSRDGESEIFSACGPLRAPQQPFTIEPDASAAAVALAAACISGGELRVPGLAPGSAQGDTRIAEHLAAFGCRSSFDARGLWACGRIEHGARLDLSGEPDLAPVLVAVAACAALRRGDSSRFSGLGTLQGKESARLDVLRDGLRAIGLEASTTQTTLEIGPGGDTRGSLVLDPRGDHRMAFAFALLGLLRDGVDVAGPECVAKSWPEFWSDLALAGATVEFNAT